MSRALLVLGDDATRQQARRWIDVAPAKTRVEFKGPTRSVSQNDRMWAHLTDISRSLTWHGRKWSTKQWKAFFIHMLRGEEWMPGEDGGFVPIGGSSSELSVAEMADLITLIEAFAVRHEVTLNDPRGPI